MPDCGETVSPSQILIYQTCMDFVYTAVAVADKESPSPRVRNNRRRRASGLMERICDISDRGLEMQIDKIGSEQVSGPLGIMLLAAMKEVKAILLEDELLHQMATELDLL